MPKLIVLFYGAESPASSVAEAAAHGAGHVRFTEVDLRAGGSHEAGTGKDYPRLSSAASLADYAGILIACPAAGENSWPVRSDTRRTLTSTGSTGRLNAKLETASAV